MPKPWALTADRGTDNKFRLRLRGGNGEIVMQGGRDYRRFSEAHEAAQALMDAHVIYGKPRTEMGSSLAVGLYTIQAVADTAGQWRTRLCAPNGAIVLHGEGYARVDSADRAVRKVAEAKIEYVNTQLR